MLAKELVGRFLLAHRNGKQMDGAAFREILGKLGYSQASFARAHRTPVRTVENWVRNGPPDFVGHMLEGMLRLAIEPPGPDMSSPDYVATPEAVHALDASLRSVLERAVRAGWPRELVAAGAISWFVEHVVAKR